MEMADQSTSGGVMAYWLFKSEPESWSWDEQKKAKPPQVEWTGVRNYQARNNMRLMQKGERGFFYHSNEQRAVVGLVEVAEVAHPDSTAVATGDQRWDCVDIQAVADMPKPVSLEMIKQDERLREMVLVKNSRLSVQPVTAEEWQIICELGGLQGALSG